MDSRDELRPAGFDDRPLEDRGESSSVNRDDEPEDRPSSATAIDLELPPRRGTRRRARRWWERRRGSRRREEQAKRPRVRPLPILVVCVVAVSALAGALVWFDPDQTSSTGSEPETDDTHVLDSAGGDDEDSSTPDQAGGSATAVGSTSMQEAPQEVDDQDDEDEGSEDGGDEEGSADRDDGSRDEDTGRRPPGRGDGGNPPGHGPQHCRDYDEWEEWLQREYDQKGWEDWMAEHC
jgi:hypothetical protein